MHHTCICISDLPSQIRIAMLGYCETQSKQMTKQIIVCNDLTVKRQTQEMGAVAVLQGLQGF